jgi:signal transduction histidine kinase
MPASNRKLEQEIIRRKKLEQALKTSEQQLRQLSHKILLTQEAERKRISRELHDTVLQPLVGISIHLASLTPKPADNPTSLRRKIAQTQRLVEKSLAMVHRFAVELRPTVLDDLGLIPALHTFMKDFMKRTGVRARLTAYAAVKPHVQHSHWGNLWQPPSSSRMKLSRTCRSNIRVFSSCRLRSDLGG